MTQWNQVDADSPRGTVQGHKELLKTILAGDAAVAAALLEHHLQSQADWFLNSFAGTDAKESDTTGSQNQQRKE